MGRPDFWKDCTEKCERLAYCTECGRRKTPRGRSAPLEMRCCDHDCVGYGLPPHPGHLWPGELADMDREESE